MAVNIMAVIMATATRLFLTTLYTLALFFKTLQFTAELINAPLWIMAAIIACAAFQTVNFSTGLLNTILNLS